MITTVEAAMLENGARLVWRDGTEEKIERNMERDIHGWFTVRERGFSGKTQMYSGRGRVLYNGGNEAIAVACLVHGAEKAREKYSW